LRVPGLLVRLAAQGLCRLHTRSQLSHFLDFERKWVDKRDNLPRRDPVAIVELHTLDPSCDWRSNYEAVVRASFALLINGNAERPVSSLGHFGPYRRRPESNNNYGRYAEDD
jgi:hypothetical protein